MPLTRTFLSFVQSPRFISQSGHFTRGFRPNLLSTRSLLFTPSRAHHDMPKPADMSRPKDTSFVTKPKEEEPANRGFALPAPGEGETVTLDVSGGSTTVKLDHLGPLVVNKDGSLARVSNWKGMTATERETTLRILGKRNKQRLEALKAAEGQDGEIQ